MQHIRIAPPKSQYNRRLMYNKLKAFTLAEVLITLVIIGVVASLTIPALINNVNDIQYKTAYKKAYSAANQAWQSALSNNEIDTRVISNDPDMNGKYFNTFKAKFKVAKDCNNNNNDQCWNHTGEMPNNMPLTDAYAFIDNSGMSWSMPNHNSNYDLIWVDTNGFNAPNQFGKDRFRFGVLNQDGSGDSGLPVKIAPAGDILLPKVFCEKPPCYNTSWLTGAK